MKQAENVVLDANKMFWHSNCLSTDFLLISAVNLIGTRNHVHGCFKNTRKVQSSILVLKNNMHSSKQHFGTEL